MESPREMRDIGSPPKQSRQMDTESEMSISKSSAYKDNKLKAILSSSKEFGSDMQSVSSYRQRLNQARSKLIGGLGMEEESS
jgi:mannitol-1-phosphate/altronate dehydrogenase